MTDTIYYLTGRGGQLDTGVGQGLLERGYQIAGREMSGIFDTLAIQNQVDLIASDLEQNFWMPDSKILAVSYGAYLLMQTLAEQGPFPGSVLLLSPVLGGVVGKEQMRYFSPPRADKLMRLIKDDLFPKPKHIEIHVGDSDWQSPFERVEQFAKALDGQSYIVPNTGHDLGKDYVSPLLDVWLAG